MSELVYLFVLFVQTALVRTSYRSPIEVRHLLEALSQNKVQALCCGRCNLGGCSNVIGSLVALRSQKQAIH